MVLSFSFPFGFYDFWLTGKCGRGNGMTIYLSLKFEERQTEIKFDFFHKVNRDISGIFF
jgi:hypothetical protein